MPGQAKHPAERHGHRTAAENAHDEMPRGAPLVWPVADPGWHPIAERWYVSLSESGQVIDYTQSDVACAYVLAENLDRLLVRTDADGARRPLSGMEISAFLTGCGDLLATARHRRSVKLEITRDTGEQAAAESAAVTSLVNRRKRSG